MSWEDTIISLYGVADQLTTHVEKNKQLSLQDAVNMPEVKALREQVLGWFNSKNNVQALLEGSEKVRAETQKLLRDIRARQARGEKPTVADFTRLADLSEADHMLSKEALAKAIMPMEILRFTISQFMPWLKLAARLTLVAVPQARGLADNEIVKTALSVGDGGAEAGTLERLEEAVGQVLAGERPLKQIAAEYGIARGELLRAAARYSEAGLAAVSQR